MAEVARLREAGAAKRLAKLLPQARQMGLVFGSELVDVPQPDRSGDGQRRRQRLSEYLRRKTAGEKPQEGDAELRAELCDYLSGRLELLSSSASGGFSTNRPPDNRQSQESPDTWRSVGGEDRFEISCQVVWPRWDLFQPLLEAAKQAAEALAEGGDDSLAPLTIVHGWQMRSKGARAGDDHNGPVYRYQLVRGGLVLLIANRRDYSGHYCNVRIVVGSLPLIEDDARRVWAGLVEELEGLGAEFHVSKPSRVDVCVDLPNVKVDRFVSMFDRGCFVTRARAGAGHGQFDRYSWAGKSTGIDIGSGMKLRIYDKVEECKDDPVKTAAMIAFRWGGKMPKLATRVEFQMRREQLKTMGVDTMEDWFKKRNDVCAYMVTEWFRFTAHAPNRESGKQADAPLASIWKYVQQKFAEWAGAMMVAIKRSKVVAICLKQLHAQVRGLVTSLYAYSEKFVRDKSQLFENAFDTFIHAIDEIPPRDLWKKLERKRAAFLASVPLSMVGSSQPRGVALAEVF